MIRRALLVAALVFASPARAEFDAAQTAERAAEMLEQAGFALLEAEGARDRVEALTQTVRAYEEGLLALREGIRQAALREQTIVMVFEAERDRLSRLLGVLQSIEAAPAPLLLMHPEGALGTARSGMILSEVTPAVAEEARALRAQLEEAGHAARASGWRTGAAERCAATRAGCPQRAEPGDRRPAHAAREFHPRRHRDGRVDRTVSIRSTASLRCWRPIPPRPPLTCRDFARARGTLAVPVLGTPAARLRRGGRRGGHAARSCLRDAAARPRHCTLAVDGALCRTVAGLRKCDHP